MIRHPHLFLPPTSRILALRVLLCVHIWEVEGLQSLHLGHREPGAQVGQGPGWLWGSFPHP